MSQYFRYPPAGSVSLSNYALEAGGNLEDIKDILDTGVIDVSGDWLTDAQLRASPVDVDVTATVLAPDASTETTLAALNAKSAAALVPEQFDEQVISYVGATTDVSTVEYKLATVTVATLTLSYDGNNRLIGVVKT
jgi:hypothetical protein